MLLKSSKIKGVVRVSAYIRITTIASSDKSSVSRLGPYLIDEWFFDIDFMIPKIGAESNFYEVISDRQKCPF
jgi:hypothetical protein